MSEADLQQYASRTAQRPGLCLLAILALPFVQELACRLAGAW